MDPEYQIDHLLSTYGLRRVLELVNENVKDIMDSDSSKADLYKRAWRHLDNALGQIRCIEGL
jgi:hypothetical protein